jgi:hypothetical protein
VHCCPRVVAEDEGEGKGDGGESEHIEVVVSLLCLCPRVTVRVKDGGEYSESGEHEQVGTV